MRSPLLPAIFVLCASPSFAGETYHGRIVSVIDSRTIQFVSDDGPFLDARLIHIQSPTPGDPLAMQARQALAQYIHRPAYFSVVRKATDNFAEGVLHVDKVDVGLTLIQKGLVKISPDTDYRPYIQAAHFVSPGNTANINQPAHPGAYREYAQPSSPPEPIPMVTKIAIALGILIAAVVAIKIRKPHDTRWDHRKPGLLSILFPLRYQRKPSFVTEPEQALYHILRKSLTPYQLVIHPQVALMQVITPTGFNKIGSLSNINNLTLDYLIADYNFQPVLVVELDDSTHSRAERKKADLRKNHALKSAGIPLMRIATEQLKRPNEIHLGVLEALAQCNVQPRSRSATQ